MTSSEKRMLLPILRKLANREKLNHRAQSAAEQLYARLTRKNEKKIAAKVRQRSEKQSSRASHNQETAKIREEVFERACNNCELCCAAPATELHHLEGGSGRRALQRASNCMAVCFNCHRFFHNAPETYREVVLSWCGTFDYPVPRRFRGEPEAIHAEPAKAGGAP